METVAPEAISAREAEVLEALGHHLTNAEIGRRLHISVRTVESHVSSLLRKLGATDRRDLATRAPWRADAELNLRPPEVVGLPSSWTTFVGRAAELAELSELISTHRLVTVVGSGGVGKTRLAAVASGRAAPEFPAGGAFVDLVPVRPEFVVQAVAAALGVVERAQEPLEQRVWERLRPGRMLLVLDNCEHVVSTVASFASSALAACPELTVLTTSRERLGIIGERVMALAPLALTVTTGSDRPEAELLFVDRAVGATGVHAASSLVSEICCHLDGMPLAIELAAARAGSLGLDGLLAGLDDHLRLLSRSGGPSDRHASMRTVIDWSHQLLDEDESALFRRLGVFVGSFDLAAAAAVAVTVGGPGGGAGGAEGELARASDGIGRLADKSLLVRAQHGDTSRWRMLDTIRAYAREQLEESGEAPEVQRRHLLWAAATAAEIERALDDDSGWRERFDAVSDDLRSALRSAPVGPGDGGDFALALSLGHLSYARRFLVEARAHLDDAVARAPDEASAVAALHVAAGAAHAEMRGEAAFVLLQAAFARAQAAGDRRAAAIALSDAAALAGRCPAVFVRPLPHEELAVMVAEARVLTPADDLEAMTHLALAAAWDSSRTFSVGELARAEEALGLARRLGDPMLISSALDAAASAIGEEGHYKEALRRTLQRLPLLDQFPRHDPRVGGEVVDVFHMGTEWALGAGEIHRALEVARSQHEDSSSRGLPHFSANHLVMPLTLQGEFDDALIQAAIMRDGWERAGAPAAGWMAPSFFAAALIHGLRGDQDRYDEFWNLAMDVRMQATLNSFGCFVGPRVALHRGAPDEAAAAAAPDEAAAAAAPDDQIMCGPYAAYARAISLEVAVVRGAPDAAVRLAAAASLAEENDYAAGYLLRAAGRLHGDESYLKQAVLQWDALGARFERACTLLLLPAHAEEGASELAALGCTLPPA